MCITLFVYMYTLLKVVSHYDFNVLSMSLMGFQRTTKVWMGSALSRFILDFWEIF